MAHLCQVAKAPYEHCPLYMYRPETWAEVCGGCDVDADRTVRLDAYAAHLDLVETHLLSEIAARSESFFEAAGVVADLRAVLGRTYEQVAGLRREVRSA